MKTRNCNFLRFFSPFFIFLLFNTNGFAQEFSTTVTIQAAKISSSIDKKTFTELQKKIEDFINTRKWTSDEYQVHEKIPCAFFINVDNVLSPDTYQGNISIQVSRPVYNSSYLSPILTYKDDDFVFKYEIGQNLIFNETNISGANPSEANLTAIFAFYAYIILGLEYNSFSKSSGKFYFAKAKYIVDNAPSGDIVGWRANDGVRNRYLMSDNLVNTIYDIFHQSFYDYYRKGLDLMFESPEKARENMLKSFENLYLLNSENQGILLIPFFMQGKLEEIIGIFKSGTQQQKSRILEICDRLDLLNYEKYKAALE